MQRYNPKDVEPKWQKTWQDSGIYKAVDFDEKPKYVMLTEFPYPSGAGIHIGHAREYTYGDMIARYKRMQGYNVLYPMGFDEFGLPTENFAIKNKVTPQSATETNVANFQKQLEALGYSFDWSRAVHTSDPEYYKWTQWLFLQFYKSGMAYQAEIAINWCPHCKTGLANEEVVNGRHERCDTIVEKKLLKQWLLKITAYADSLIEGLKTVDYPSRIADQQVNWIGRSSGAEVVFPVEAKERYVSLHCFKGSPDMEFQPWLARALREAGHEVSVPELPNSQKPVVSDQVAAVLQTETFDADTVLIGHSLGTVVALKTLETIDTKIKRLVLVAGFAEPGFSDGKRPFEKTFDWQFDFEKIKANVGEIIILRDTTDPAVPAERADFLQQKLGGTIVDFVAEKPHVCGDIEPVVLEHIRPSVKVFTTRVDTLFGADFLVLAPEHPLVDTVTTDEHRAAVNNYRKAAAAKTDIERQSTEKDKTGVPTGAHVVNPISGKRIPVWIADYVLTGYGTGAIMAVPAHDQRDYAFAKKYNLPVTEVVVRHEIYSDKNAPRDDVETLDRKVVDAIIVNEKGQYLLQIEPDNTHFVGGGIEKTDANDVAAVKREVLEETGYSDIKSVKQVSSTTLTTGYRFTKQKNQKCEGRFYEVVLGSDERIASEADTDKHSIKWVNKKDVVARLTWNAHSFAWEQYTAGNHCFNGSGQLINSGQYNGMDSQDAKAKIIADLTAKGLGGEKINYRLRDWVFSRQHYWGEPIPVIHCAEHGAVAVPEDQLPVVLPKVDHYEPTDTGESPLSEIDEWVNTTCPECGGPAKRETDTMPNWAGSSWYYLRYFDAHNDTAFADREKLEYWKDVDLYLGGMEHTTLHLLYSRFWHQFFYEQGLVPTPEPYAARRGQGIIQATDGTKMSKSKGNVVNPSDIIDSGYGADALRMAIAFLAPYDQTTPWSPEAVAGTHRVLQRTWTLLGEYAESDGGTTDSPELERIINKAIKKVTEDLDTLGFNTAIAAIMECVNELYAVKKDGFEASEWQWALESLVLLLAPFAPHITEELWEQLGHTESIHKTSWPTFDEAKLVQDTIKIVIQVNGKVRGDIEVAADATEDEVVHTAKANERVAGYLDEKDIRKTIYVAGKLVSFVV